jgi:hypothetical protein
MYVSSPAIFLTYFFPIKSYALNLAKSGLGYFLGDFSHKTSGHPGHGQAHEWRRIRKIGSCLSTRAGLPDFLGTIYQHGEKVYQFTKKYTKWP